MQNICDFYIYISYIMEIANIKKILIENKIIVCAIVVIVTLFVLYKLSTNNKEKMEPELSKITLNDIKLLKKQETEHQEQELESEHKQESYHEQEQEQDSQDSQEPNGFDGNIFSDITGSSGVTNLSTIPEKEDHRDYNEPATWNKKKSDSDVSSNMARLEELATYHD